MSMKKTDLDKMKGKQLGGTPPRKGRNAPPERPPRDDAAPVPLAVRLIRERQKGK